MIDLTDPKIIDDLDDHAFVFVGSGGARDHEGKTFPRVLRFGAHHEPSARTFSVGRRGLSTVNVAGPEQDKVKGTLSPSAVARTIAEINAGTFPMSRQERESAWKHMRQHAAELDLAMPPKRF